MAPTVTHWPTCPTCGHPLTLTIGCPVVIGPAGRSLVTLAIDVSEADGWDDSATVSCGCEGGDTFRPQELLDDLGRCVAETMMAASMNAEAIVNRTDDPL